jgi:hypothetical protein
MFSGAFGRIRDQRRRLHVEKSSLIRSNPAAFQEDVAERAEAEYRWAKGKERKYEGVSDQGAEEEEDDRA